MSKPNSHRVIFVTIWDDPDWRKLSAGAQWTYFMMLTQKDLTKAGTMSYNPRKWAKGCEALDEAHVDRCVRELAAHRFVYLDDDTDEVLIRTYIRNDGVANQPNVLISACRAAALVSSSVLRDALAFELGRVQTPSFAPAAQMLADTLAFLAPDGVPSEAPEPFPNPSRNPSAKGSGTLPGTLNPPVFESAQVSDGFRNPSANPSGTLPGRVGGGGGGYCSSSSTTLFRPSSDEKIAFDAFREAYPKPVPDSVEVQSRWKSACNEHGVDRVLKSAERYAGHLADEGTDPRFAKNPTVWFKDGLFVEHLPDEMEPYVGMDVVAWLDTVTARRDVATAIRYGTGDTFLPEWPAEYEGWTKAEADAFRESDKDRWFREHRDMHLEVLSRRYGGVQDAA